MNNSINFTGRSNTYFAITKKGWGNAIPDKAYKQIDNNRTAFEKFARKNNIKITFTDASNMLPEFHSGNVSNFLSGRMAIQVEKKPSLGKKIRNGLLNLVRKSTKRDPKIKLSVMPYFSKDSKNLPTLQEQRNIGFYLEYEPYDGKMQEQINLDTVAKFLQRIVGKKSGKLSLSSNA